MYIMAGSYVTFFYLSFFILTNPTSLQSLSPFKSIILTINCSYLECESGF